MNEIKFRAWEERCKEMHYDFQFIKSGNDGNDWIIFTSDKQKIDDKQHPFQNPYFQQQFKIMQFTGLKDKNGKEIYEGDIIRSFDSTGEPVKHTATWNKLESRYNMQQDWIDEFKFEVIGNIYGDL